ncbi:hypothetical protein RUM43_013766 [Polyplax serrata]|uniref:Uncharacterized protein n=1 Tax=Polyplax serrata TaxID=468196 RepID=A0AAN8PH98_POLSC
MGETIAPTDSQVPSDEKGKIVLRNGSANAHGPNSDFRKSFNNLELNDAVPRGQATADKVSDELYVKPRRVNDSIGDGNRGLPPTVAKRPSTLCPGFPFPTSSTAPSRRFSGSYISSGVSCIIPANPIEKPLPQNVSLFRRPTSLNSQTTSNVVPNHTDLRGFAGTPQQPNNPFSLPPQSSGFHTWNHNRGLIRRPASFCGSSSSTSSNTWNPNIKNGTRRPLSMGPSLRTTPGKNTLPSSVSDYMLSSYQTTKKTELTSPAQRHVSFPSAQAQLRPKLSPSALRLALRPFTCGVSPNGTPIFLGCTHLHPSPSPNKSKAGTPTTSQAIQNLLLNSRNGYQTPDDKIALFFEILDSQERFAKVKILLLS